MGKSEEVSNEAANQLVLEFKSWAEGIAKSVARGWHLDWQADALDGAAMEALIFCSRRFDSSMGVPFKSYARKRIHEAATEAAKKSKSWQKDSRESKRTKRLARAISAELFAIFPQLHAGSIPSENDGEEASRVGIQQLLISACLISTKHGVQSASPHEAMEFKNLARELSELEPLHQQIMWMAYWEGHSLRNIAEEWNTDELNVIREHKAILEYLQKTISSGKDVTPPKLRPGLQESSLTQKKDSRFGIFTKNIGGSNGR